MGYTPKFSGQVRMFWEFNLLGSLEISLAASGNFLWLSGQEETSVFSCIIIVVAGMPAGEGSKHHAQALGNKRMEQMPRWLRMKQMPRWLDRTL